MLPRIAWFRKGVFIRAPPALLRRQSWSRSRSDGAANCGSASKGLWLLCSWRKSAPPPWLFGAAPLPKLPRSQSRSAAKHAALNHSSASARWETLFAYFQNVHVHSKHPYGGVAATGKCSLFLA